MKLEELRKALKEELSKNVWWSAVPGEPTKVMTTPYQPSTQDIIDELYQLVRQSISTSGILDHTQGEDIMKQKLPPLWKEDLQCRSLCWKQVGRIISGQTPIPEGFDAPEFGLGILQEEERFKISWEGDMRKNWGQANQQVAKVWLEESKGVICARFPYKSEVIEEIKEQIPTGKKSWNPEDKIWEFSVETIDTLINILEEHFEEVIDLTKAESPNLPQVVSGDPLLSLLDKEEIQQVYILLAKRNHPDITKGDGEKMAKINEVFKKIRRC